MGLQCGGSDGYSGLTANPLGHADLLVQNGGTVVLSETLKYRAEHLLTKRAVTEEVGKKLADRINGGTTPLFWVVKWIIILLQEIRQVV